LHELPGGRNPNQPHNQFKQHKTSFVNKIR